MLEPHALASLNAVIEVLEQIQDPAPGGGHPLPPPTPPVDFKSGPQRLREHTQALLGSDPQGRHVRIMVSMPSEAATDAQLVRNLVEVGMDVMRINCAHDGPAEWAAMVDNLRLEVSGGLLAELAVGDQLDFTDARGQAHCLQVREFQTRRYTKGLSGYQVRRPYQSVGSGTGVRNVINRTFDFGASDAAMTDEGLPPADPSRAARGHPAARDRRHRIARASRGTGARWHRALRSGRWC